MPELSGFELTRKIREFNPEIKVILMTAFDISKKEVSIILPSTKTNGFLNKPLRKADLMQAIEQCVKDG